MDTKPPFPSVISNSIRSTFKSCHREAYNKYFLKRIPVIPSIHLHAGGAFAKGMEATRQAYFVAGLSDTDALLKGTSVLLDSYGDLPEDDTVVKTAERMAGALQYYFTIFPLETDFIKPHVGADGKPMIETSFAIPLPISHPQTGDPLLYAGRFDMVGDNAGSIFIVDEKTTNALGPTWGARYDNSGQFTGYVYAMQQYGLPIGGIMIRGIAILKEKYNHAQHIMYRPQHVIDRWYKQLLVDTADMIRCWESGYWDYDFADACGSFGGCDFRTVCTMNDPDDWLQGSNFMHNPYDPLKPYAG